MLIYYSILQLNLVEWHSGDNNLFRQQALSIISEERQPSIRNYIIKKA